MFKRLSLSGQPRPRLLAAAGELWELLGRWRSTKRMAVAHHQEKKRSTSSVETTAGMNAEQSAARQWLPFPLAFTSPAAAAPADGASASHLSWEPGSSQSTSRGPVRSSTPGPQLRAAGGLRHAVFSQQPCGTRAAQMLFLQQPLLLLDVHAVR